MKKFSLLFLVAFLFAALALPAYADSSITVSNQDVNLDFPKTMTFTMDVTAPAEIQNITLVAHFRDVTRRVKAKFTPGTSVQAKIEWNLDTESSGNDGGYLPPGVEFNYSWLIEDAAGGKLETPTQSFTITDTRIHWDVVENDSISIHWYGASHAWGQAVYDAAVAMLPQLRQELGAEPKTKVNVWLYSNRDDFRSSMPDMNDWTGGRSFGEYSSILLLVSQYEQQQAIQGVRHELTHQVIYDSLGNGLARTAFPHWMNEGLATYHEFDGKGLADYLQEPLDQAIKNNTVTRLKTLDGNFSPNSNEALLSYALSYSIIEMMLKQDGQDKMREAFALFKTGTHAEEVFQTVYGVNTDGLDNDYRKSVGLPPRNLTQGAGSFTPAAMPTFSLSSAETPEPKAGATATTQSVSVANTPAPGAATPAAQNPSGTNSGGASTGLCGGVLGGFALAMFGAYEWRKRRSLPRL